MCFLIADVCMRKLSFTVEGKGACSLSLLTLTSFNSVTHKSLPVNKDTLPTLVASANLCPTSPSLLVLANFYQLNTYGIIWEEGLLTEKMSWPITKSIEHFLD